MSKVCAYLLFNGNCLEAMTFYKECLGGTLRFQLLNEHSESEFPDKMGNLVVQAVLSGKHFSIYGTDLRDSDPTEHGTSMQLLLDVPGRMELQRIFDKLSHNGEQVQPPAKNNWGNLVAELRDPYGFNWLLHCSNSKM